MPVPGPGRSCGDPAGRRRHGHRAHDWPACQPGPGCHTVQRGDLCLAGDPAAKQMRSVCLNLEQLRPPVQPQKKPTRPGRAGPQAAIHGGATRPAHHGDVHAISTQRLDPASHRSQRRPAVWHHSNAPVQNHGREGTIDHRFLPAARLPGGASGGNPAHDRPALLARQLSCQSPRSPVVAPHASRAPQLAKPTPIHRARRAVPGRAGKGRKPGQE